MRAVVLLSGPTASGKSACALKIAQELRQSFPIVSLISADSRQIFRDLPILSGADIPQTFTLSQKNDWPLPYWQDGQILWHCVAALGADSQWSAAQFQSAAHAILERTWSMGGIPIIVGGTGLYLQQLWQDDPQFRVEPNQAVRAQAAIMPLQELQAWAERITPGAYANLNDSDRANPRRLIRLLEQAMAPLSTQDSPGPRPSVMHVCLSLPMTSVAERIEARVLARLRQGAVAEVDRARQAYDPLVWRHSTAFSATGVKEICGFLDEVYDQQALEALWIRREVQYAKRQLTWLKKYAASASWVDVTVSETLDQTIEQITAWVLAQKKLYSNHEKVV